MPAAPAGFTSRLFVSGALTFVLIGLLGGAYGVSLPGMTRDFGLDEGVAAWMLTASLLGGLSSVLAQLVGLPGLTLRAGLVLLALGAGAIAAEWTWPLVLAGTYLAGTGFGLIATHVNRDFLQGFGPRGPGMVGLVNAISGLGLIGAPLAFLVAGQSVNLLFCGIALFALVLIPLAMPSPVQAGPRGFPRLSAGQAGILSLNTVSGVIEASISGLGVTALIALSRTEAEAAAMASGFFAAYTAGRLGLYWLTRWFPPVRIFLAGTILSALMCGTAVLGWPGLAHVALGATIGIMFPSYYVWAANRLGGDPRMGAAILIFGMGGGAIGPPLLTWLLSGNGGIGNLYAVSGLVALALAAAIVMALRRQPQAA